MGINNTQDTTTRTILRNIKDKASKPFSEDDILTYGHKVYDMRKSSAIPFAQWCVAHSIGIEHANIIIQSKGNSRIWRDKFALLVLLVASSN